MMTSKRRSPQGMQSDKPVAVRFTADEKAELVELCHQEDRTQSSMVRIIYQHGLAAFKASRSTRTR